MGLPFLAISLFANVTTKISLLYSAKSSEAMVLMLVYPSPLLKKKNHILSYTLFLHSVRHAFPISRPQRCSCQSGKTKPLYSWYCIHPKLLSSTTEKYYL